MYRLFKFLLPAAILVGATLPLEAHTFFLKRIDIKGLQGISPESVLSYLPIKTGQNFDSEESSKLIDALYATGFFSNVNLQEQGNTLIINVVERPTIDEIVFTGNKSIPKDKLDDLLKKVGLTQGQLFDNSVLERLIAQMRSQYDLIGKYATQINPTIIPQTNNRVAIQVKILEGSTVEVAGISIIGNHAFTQAELTSDWPMTSTHLWSFISHANEYNQTKLMMSLQALQSYYLNRGYLKFKIDSTHAVLTPDRKSVDVIIHITEGPLYRFKGYEVIGNIILNETKLQNFLSSIKSGESFSRQTVMEAESDIKKALATLGYSAATVNTLPNINEKNKTVFLTFYIDPGNQIYVRHINIKGNLKTEDEVFRRILLQQEGSLLSGNDLQESIRRLNLSGFIEGEPQINIVPVPGCSDQVDLNLNVTEAHAAQALFSLGYGTNGAVVSTALNQNNVFGTGNQLGINFNNTRAATVYSVSYNNPYYTLNGVQRGFDFYYQRSTPSNLNTTTYSTNTYGANLQYGIPVDKEGDTLNLSGGLQKQQLNLPPFDGLSRQVKDFVIHHGTQFNQFLLSVGWGRNGLDRFIFPRKGLYQAASLQLVLPIEGRPLNYYKANYKGIGYYPLGNDFIVESRLIAGYGNGFASTKGLPFFVNYYAGGVGIEGQVRGYEISSLGPRDSNSYPLGGNILTVGSIALILPMPASVADKVRTSLFVDAGNVYSTLGSEGPNNPSAGTSSGPLRYSTGVNVDWRVPVFNVTLSLSVAKVINPRPGDQLQFFQFNIGTGI